VKTSKRSILFTDKMASLGNENQGCLLDLFDEVYLRTKIELFFLQPAHAEQVYYHIFRLIYQKITLTNTT